MHLTMDVVHRNMLLLRNFGNNKEQEKKKFQVTFCYQTNSFLNLFFDTSKVLLYGILN